MERTAIVIAGATASGKTACSVELAARLNGEIISADSMQAYIYMDIGTAKATEAERGGIKHYMLDIAMPTEPLNTARFCEMAQSCKERIFAEGHPALLVGGSGLYLDSLVYSSYDFTYGQIDSAYRGELNELYAQKGAAALYEMLQKVDPEYAELTHPNNVKRVMRALEYVHSSGHKKSAAIVEKRLRDKTHYFVLDVPREQLYERINRRVDRMLEAGLLEEVKFLLSIGCTRDMNSMQAIGYKELIAYLEGETSLEDAVEQIKRASRNYAKRQYTWFRRNRDVIWVNTADFRGTASMCDYLEEKINENKQ